LITPKPKAEPYTSQGASVGCTSPRPTGGQRPLGVTALEDKIAQRAAVEVWNAIYETDFLGFYPAGLAPTSYCSNLENVYLDMRVRLKSQPGMG